MMARKPAVRKNPTALCPYHHWIIASWTPDQTGYDFDENIETGISVLLPSTSTAIVMMKAR